MPTEIRKTTFDEFFESRDALFYLYQKGDITKKEFIEEHYFDIQRLKLKPFMKIDSYEKGLYNYQYYNAIAKYNKLKARDKKLLEKHPEIVKEIDNKVKESYKKKEDSLLRLLRFLDYENMEAYFIKSKSEYLDGKLFEVVLFDYDNAIFHSTSTYIRDELTRECVFVPVRKKSKIDDYVNKKY